MKCFISFLLLALFSTTTTTHAATFEIRNNCPFTVWAAAVPGGGRQMNRGDTWTITANPGTTGARIWARTGCTSTGPNGLRCTTGDCNGVLQCTTYGTPPNTLAEYALRQFNNLDFFDISLVDGFNVPMSFLPVSGCARGPTCTADVNGSCPAVLRTNGGCNNPSLSSTTTTHAATFEIRNNCPFTVWAAALPGGGRQMNRGDTWTITANPGTTGGRIWARTGCTSTGPNGLRCTTGDCNGLLQCTTYGSPPDTLAEYALNQFNNLDFFDMSLVDGFNVPMSFLPTSNGCTRGPTCAADVNGSCPAVLRTNGGCNNPCTVFKTDEYYPKMNTLKALPIFSFILVALFSKPTHGTTFDIQNNCSYTIWAAAMPGGGKQLNPGDTWSILFNSTNLAIYRIWARTGCNVTGLHGLKCETGDCGGLVE
ncbi:hypothetical protein Cgig2_002422 [Carnegiea gigantea]|uniref:Thaumatin-like protein n=1 Tax=Carnegiea gigantea TaxID=171969 RepID=A0A9Q1KUG0_9CARY|nr:hypothetical protein Cgig2_002422 [Carnegiea gigantea]